MTKKIKSLYFCGGGGITTNLEAFNAIPSNIFAYWISNNLRDAFINGRKLLELANPRQGMATSDNNRFLRLWFEVDKNNSFFNATDYIQAMYTGKKWFPYNKGGEFRKWYGNNDYLINYQNNGKEVKDYATKLYKTPTRTIKSQSYYFFESITWSKISSGNISFRYKPNGYVFDVAGTSIFADKTETLKYLIALLNTNVLQSIVSATSPTLNYESGQIANLPVIMQDEKKVKIENIVDENINTSKEDWDSFETSWDFKKHPLI